MWTCWLKSGQCWTLEDESSERTAGHIVVGLFIPIHKSYKPKGSRGPAMNMQEIDRHGSLCHCQEAERESRKP